MLKVTDEKKNSIEEADTPSNKFGFYGKVAASDFKYDLVPSGSGTYILSESVKWNGDNLEECLKHVKEDTKKTYVTENPVSSPPHYIKHPSGIECIEITRHMSFNLGNAVKYIWRADLKNDALEDLKKAAWYIQDEIRRREGRQ